MTDRWRFKPPTPSVEQKRTSPVPPVQEDVVPTGGNTSSQLPRKKYVLVSVSVDTIPVESGLAVWQVTLLNTNFVLFQNLRRGEGMERLHTLHLCKTLN